MSYKVATRKPKDTYFHVMHEGIEYIVDRYGEITSVDKYRKAKSRRDLMYSENESLSQVENFAYLVQEFSKEMDNELEVWFTDCSQKKQEERWDKEEAEQVAKEMEFENKRMNAELNRL
jgi:hypothetical protein